MSDTDQQGFKSISRRQMMQWALVGGGALLSPWHMLRAQTLPSRSLSFAHTHTGEKLAIAYWNDQTYLPNSLARIDHLLRDFRTGDVHAIDPTLLDVLYAVQLLTDRDITYEVISGYRSPHTNSMLRKHSSGVAEHSLHVVGRAIDVRIDGFSTRTLRDLALSLQRGGVGFYAASDFVHIDTGRVRSWQG